MHFNEDIYGRDDKLRAALKTGLWAGKAHLNADYWAFCKTKIFVQNQGMREILPQAYDWYSEDKISSITQSLGEKIVLQMAHIAEIGRRSLQIPESPEPGRQDIVECGPQVDRKFQVRRAIS